MLMHRSGSRSLDTLLAPLLWPTSLLQTHRLTTELRRLPLVRLPHQVIARSQYSKLKVRLLPFQLLPRRPSQLRLQRLFQPPLPQPSQPPRPQLSCQKSIRRILHTIYLLPLPVAPKGRSPRKMWLPEGRRAETICQCAIHGTFEEIVINASSYIVMISRI